MSGIIEVQNISFNYGQTEILRQVTFDIAQGSFLAIAGANGAGKTTLLNLICGQLKPSVGQILIEGKKASHFSTKKLAQKIAVVRQEFVPVFDFTVAQMVLMGRAAWVSSLGFESSDDQDRAADAMKATGVIDFADRPLAQLSGGERQRVFIARAIAQDTPIMLLDEPTSFLDLKHQVGIFDLLKQLQTERGKTIVIVTHDINLAGQYCDQAVLLGSGGRYFQGRCEDVFVPEQISEIFGVQIFSADIAGRRFIMPEGKYPQKT